MGLSIGVVLVIIGFVIGQLLQLEAACESFFRIDRHALDSDSLASQWKKEKEQREICM